MDVSCSYIKFGKKCEINDQARVFTRANDRPDGIFEVILIIEKYPKSILRKSLMKIIHIWNIHAPVILNLLNKT